jgi:hypothetical protein
MGYYRGDFYGGYRGDPGFFSFLGGLAKKAVGFIPGVGPAISTALSAIPSKAHTAIQVVKETQLAKTAGRVVGKGVAIASKHPVLTAAGAAGTLAAGGAAAKMMGHGTAAAAGMGAPGGGRGMRVHTGRRRRMNVCNPRALRRAIRRTHSFARLAMKTIHLVHPKKHVTFGGFKRKRKR